MQVQYSHLMMFDIRTKHREYKEFSDIISQYNPEDKRLIGRLDKIREKVNIMLTLL